MNLRERFIRCNKFQSVDHAPFPEIDAWSQTREMWFKEGMLKDVDTYFYILSEGNEYFGFEYQYYLELKVDMDNIFGVW